MNVFAVVKENVTARQVAMQYASKSTGVGWLVVRFIKTRLPA